MRSSALLLIMAFALASCGGGGGGGRNTPTSDALLNAPQDSDNWPLVGKDYAFNRYVTTNEITPQNVTLLRKAWITPLADDGEQESAPVIWNGTIYIATPHDNVLALNGSDGAVKWSYPYAPAYVLLYSVTRGLGLANGKVFLGTQDCHVIALDASSGKQLWNVLGCNGTTGFSSTQNSWYSNAMYPYDGAVIAGLAGGDTGNVGLVSAFDQNTGKRLWDWHTVPEPGDPNFGTWPGNSWQHGGSDVWAGLSIDPITKTLYIGPGNAGPNLTLVGRKGRDLYSDSLVALDISGAKPRVKWYYQLLQNDTHDADPAMPPVLFDGTVGGTKQPLVAIADKDGNFVILNRADGRVVHRLAVTKQDDILGLPTLSGLHACPNHGGGVEWNGGSYDARTNYFIVPGTQECALWKVLTTGPVTYIPGLPYAAGPLPKRNAATGVISAIDVGTGKVVWRHATPYGAQGGVTLTSSGIAFTSDTGGNVYALDPKTGRELWHDNLGSSLVDSISFYRVNNQAYLVTVAGEAGNQHTPNLPKTQGSRVVAYALHVSNTVMNTTASQPTPAPMATGRTESAAAITASAPYTPAQVTAGLQVYKQSCAVCHGAKLQGVSAPALTGASFGRANLNLSQLRTITTTQMPLSAPGSLTPQQYASVIAYMLKYDCVSPAGGGKTPFPTSDQPQFKTIIVPGATCPTK